LNASNLQDDELHKQTEVLAAAALADLSGGSGVVFGSMLSRVKYSDGISHKTFESGNQNLTVLLKVWTAAVTEKRKARNWIKVKAKWASPRRSASTRRSRCTRSLTGSAANASSPRHEDQHKLRPGLHALR
jgi:hypothetical protein